jgi:small redox-active disulfide protein 2
MNPLWNKKTKKEDQSVSCACGGTCQTPQATPVSSSDACSPQSNAEPFQIIVLGSGCKTCHDQYEYVQKTLKELNCPVEAEYITDMSKIMAYGVMSMPALVVNGTVVSSGKVLKPADLKKVLHKLGV